MQLTIAKDLKTLQQALIEATRQGKRIGFVPTMGALHDGHLALVNVAKQNAEAVVMSIFVNPTQFGPNEDFSKYPRMFDADVQKAASAGVDIIYAPTVEDMYPQGFATKVVVGPIANILCGKSRPGHFDGVATVVTKLFLRVLPHVAVFGEKDYQQLCVIRRLVYDLDLPMGVLGMPTMREADGLAMSSRNAYLSPQERKIAPKLFETLILTADKLKKGESAKDAIETAKTALTQAGFVMDYLELRTALDLEPVEKLEGQARLLVAAKLGHTRLIDNIGLEA